MAHDVVLIPGDGIGPEITQAMRRVVEATGVQINWNVQEAGAGVMDEFGTPLPQHVLDAVAETKVAIKGPITTPVGTGFRSVNVALRKHFDLYACVRPCLSQPGDGSRFRDVDLVIVRENTEDLYAAVEFFPLPEEMFLLHKGMERFREGKGEIAVSWRVFSEEGCTRIIRAAFEYAKATGRKTVHCCNKANVIRQTDGMMKRIFLEIAKEYEQYGIKGIEENADATAMWLIKNPQDYSVIVASNVFGDILSDEASQLTGGLGFAPSGNIGRSTALFEPSSGSVPKYAHQYKVNPSAMILTCKMMLEYLGLDEAAQKIEKALGEVLVESRPGTLTYDVLRDFRGDPDWEKNAASTIDMAAAIAQKINPEFTGEKLEAAKKKVHEMCAWDEASLVGFDD